ncbi:MAG TPA: hypothetical protein PKI11_19840, partial [Candidatus Hydrogenedentes bacterium]|nr:hypothetical protein [Candidatus Hydrogenedentota bacterium]
HAFPIPDTPARFFVAPLTDPDVADLAVLHGHALTVYPRGLPDTPRTLPLPPETSAVDVFDLDGDDVAEVIAVAGDRIVSWSLAAAETSPTPIDLFRLSTQLADCGPAPFLYVLGVEWEGRVVLGLPRETTFELRDVAGALVGDFPLTTEAPHRASYGRPFTMQIVDPPLIGPEHALEIEVRRSIEIEPDLPRALAPPDKRAALQRRSIAPPGIATPEANPAYWPWFPLVPSQTDPVGREELARWDVLYALADAGAGASLIRLRTPGRTPQDAPRVGPERRFPGAILNTPDRLPDFNGDGFTDLALWNPAEQWSTPNALARAAVTGRAAWRLTVHLFEPARRRFSPAPTAQLRVDAPFSWTMRARADAPTPIIVFEDFTGDGRTDFGCATAVDEFRVWRAGETGFDPAPAFRARFAEPVHAIEFVGRFDRAAAAVALRGEDTLFLLRPAP